MRVASERRGIDRGAQRSTDLGVDRGVDRGMGRRIGGEDPLHAHRARLRCGLALAVVQSLLALAQPWPLTLAVDHVIGGTPFTGPLSFLQGWSSGGLTTLSALSFVGLVVLGSLVGYGQTVLVGSAGERIARDLRSTVLRHLLSLDPRFHDAHRSGDLSSRLSADVARVEDALTARASTLVPDVLLLVGMVVVLLRVDVGLGLVALGAIPLLALVAQRRRRAVRRTQQVARRDAGVLASVSVEVIRNVRMVQAFARERDIERRFDEQNDRATGSAVIGMRTEARFSPLTDLVLACGSAAVLWIGVHRVQSGAISTGTLLLVLSYVGMVYSPVRSLSRLSTTLAKGAASRARLDEVLTAVPAVPELPGAVRCPPVRRGITVDDVHFAYRPDAPVLQGLSLHVEAGEHVAVVGRTGAGKSTLLQLLLRFYDPAAGSVRVDGVDVRLVSLTSLRQRIGVVPQRSWVFDGTIAENIAFGRDHVDPDEVRLVGRFALVDEFAERLPQGYDTPVGEGGAQLSGGQLKRIALARALLRMPEVLLLDEPTSGLDALSEQHVIEVIRRIAGARTVVTVTHDLALAQVADRVAVVEGGRVVEIGPPTQLAAAGGAFTRLLEAGVTGQGLPAPSGPVAAVHAGRR